MHGGGGGLLAQGLKAHTMIGLVVTAVCYGRKESRVVYSISYPTVAFVHLGFVLCIAEYRIICLQSECGIVTVPSGWVTSPLWLSDCSRSGFHRIIRYSTLSVGLEYTLCALPKFADQGPFD